MPVENPPEGFIKANFDVTFSKEKYRSRARIVLRNSFVEVVASKATLSANVPSAYAVEAVVCSQVVDLGLELRIKKKIVKGDSLSVIKKCNSSKNDKSELNPFIRNIKNKLHCFERIQFMHVYRRDNSLADLLATLSLKREEEFYLFGAVPGFAIATTMDDWIREPN